MYTIMHYNLYCKPASYKDRPEETACSRGQAGQQLVPECTACTNACG